MASKVHIFEQAGLGVAPFRLVRVEERLFQAAPGEAVRAGASCDFCGTAIRYACIVRDAEGREFKVGSECVRKTGDAGMMKKLSAEESTRRKAQAAEKDRLWVERNLEEGKKALARRRGEEWADELISGAGTTYPWKTVRRNLAGALADEKATAALDAIMVAREETLRALPHPVMQKLSLYDYAEYIRDKAPQVALSKVKKALGI